MTASSSSRRRLPALALAAALLSTSLTACVSNTSDTPTASGGAASGGATAAACKDPVKIGVAMARTGFMAPFDGPAIDTAKIAMNKLNASGGVNGCQLEMIEVDTESNPDKGAQVATDMVAKGVKLLMVTCDYDINAKASQVGQKAGVLVIAPCVGDTIMGPDSGLTLGFSLGSAVPGEAAIMAEYAFEKIGKKAALFKDMTIKYTQNQCKAFEARYKELGGTIVAAPEFTQTQQGSLAAPVTAQVAEIAKSGADVVALCSFPGGGAEAMAALRKGGVNTPTISGFGMDGAFWLGAVPNLNDAYVVTYASVFGDDTNPKVTELLADFKKLTGKDAATSGLVTGASTIEAFAEAAKVAGSFDGAALAKAMEGFKDVPLTAGPTSFSPELHVNVTRPMAVLKITNGKDALVEYRAAQKPVL